MEQKLSILKIKVYQGISIWIKIKLTYLDYYLKSFFLTHRWIYEPVSFKRHIFQNLIISESPSKWHLLLIFHESWCLIVLSLFCSRFKIQFLNLLVDRDNFLCWNKLIHCSHNFYFHSKYFWWCRVKVKPPSWMFQTVTSEWMPWRGS